MHAWPHQPLVWLRIEALLPVLGRDHEQVLHLLARLGAGSLRDACMQRSA